MCRCARGKRKGPCWHKRGKRFPLQDARELRMRHAFTQPFLVAAVADDEKPGILLVLLEFVLNFDEQPDILLDRKTPDEAEDDHSLFGVARAFRGMEELGVHAARHQDGKAARWCVSRSAHSSGLGAKSTLACGKTWPRSPSPDPQSFGR